MCGNGIRCLAKYLRNLEGKSASLPHAQSMNESISVSMYIIYTCFITLLLLVSPGGPGDKTYKISTLAGTIVPVVRDDGLVTVDMGEPILEGT